MLMVRGTVLRSTVNYIGSHLSPEALKTWMDGLAPEDRGFLDQPPLAHEWHPADALAHLMESYVWFKSADPEREYFAMGRASCDDSLTTDFRQGPSPLSPDYMVRRAVSIWGHYYNQGVCEVHLKGPGEALFRVTGIEVLHAPLCVRISGWMHRALELSGAVEPKVTHAGCSFGGRRFEEWRAVWKS
jgi:hypothetical protein